MLTVYTSIRLFPPVTATTFVFQPCELTGIPNNANLTNPQIGSRKRGRSQLKHNVDCQGNDQQCAPREKMIPMLFDIIRLSITKKLKGTKDKVCDIG